MVNGSRYHTALERVSISSALFTALTIYPCQIRVYQRWQSKLQLPPARMKDWWPATADSSPHAVTCQHCDTHYFSRPRTRNLPIVDWLLVRRVTSSAADSPNLNSLICCFVKFMCATNHKAFYRFVHLLQANVEWCCLIAGHSVDYRTPSAAPLVVNWQQVCDLTACASRTVDKAASKFQSTESSDTVCIRSARTDLRWRPNALRCW